jgi:hypothetical protein
MCTIDGGVGEESEDAFWEWVFFRGYFLVVVWLVEEGFTVDELRKIFLTRF